MKRTIAFPEIMIALIVLAFLAAILVPAFTAIRDRSQKEEAVPNQRFQVSPNLSNVWRVRLYTIDDTQTGKSYLLIQARDRDIVLREIEPTHAKIEEEKSDGNTNGIR